ncbi:transposase (plasmid) [Enterococcus faecium]|nr:transposase [Enterococcus faecium]
MTCLPLQNLWIVLLRQRRTYSKEFKQQIVDLYLAGKPRAEIIREYELTPSSFDKWMKQAQSTGSFKERDNLTPEQAELIALRKKNKQLEMELCLKLFLHD